MDFLELNKKNRSYRNYDETVAVTWEQLESLVELTRYCPSSVNMQPFKYFISHTAETNAKIQPLTKWARALQPAEIPKPGHYPTAFIVICYDETVGPGVDRFWKDVGIVAQTIVLGASAMDLGGCLIGNFSPAQISSALDLPQHLRPVLIVAIGKPEETIIVLDAKEGENLSYYRDENDAHYVPKRKLEELLINRQ
jgi:nitroreductase